MKSLQQVRNDLPIYRALLASRVRSQRSYRAMFALDLLATALIVAVDTTEMLLVYFAATEVGGLSIQAGFLVTALGIWAHSFAELVAGHVDMVGLLARQGMVEVLYVRPLPILAQLICGDVALRRVGKAAVAVLLVGAAILTSGIDWSVATVVILALSFIFGPLIFVALWVAAGALELAFLGNSNLANSVTYGGGYSAHLPATVLYRPLRLLFCYLLPIAFVSYLPVLVATGEPGPVWLPSWLAWFLPLVVIWAGLWATFAWRAAVRSYQGAGG